MCLDKMSNVVLQTYIYIYIYPYRFLHIPNSKKFKKGTSYRLGFFLLAHNPKPK